MKGLFWTPILIDIISLCVIFHIAKFVFTGRTGFKILAGQDIHNFVISSGEDYEEDFKKEKTHAPKR